MIHFHLGKPLSEEAALNMKDSKSRKWSMETSRRRGPASLESSVCDLALQTRREGPHVDGETPPTPSRLPDSSLQASPRFLEQHATIVTENEPCHRELVIVRACSPASQRRLAIPPEVFTVYPKPPSASWESHVAARGKRGKSSSVLLSYS